MLCGFFPNFSVCLFIVVSCLCLLFYLLLSLLSPTLLSFLLPSVHFLPLPHVLSSLFIQDYESKLQALQKQVETRSLAAETTEEEEEEEEGEIWRWKLPSV